MNRQVNYYQCKLDYEIDPSDLFHFLENEEDYVVIDTRQSQAFSREHIPGAINIPYKEMNVETIKHLDPQKTYVCYCDGIGCNGSTKGSLNMAKLGFKVKELIGGFEWWKLDGFATEGMQNAKGVNIKCAC